MLKESSLHVFAIAVFAQLCAWEMILEKCQLGRGLTLDIQQLCISLLLFLHGM